MIKNNILKIGHLPPKILILHLTMFLDQINSPMLLLFKVLTLSLNIKFKSQSIEDNKLKFLARVHRFLANKFMKKKNIFKKEDFIQKVHLIPVFLLLIRQNKLNVKSIKWHKKKNFWISK